LALNLDPKPNPELGPWTCRTKRRCTALRIPSGRWRRPLGRRCLHASPGLTPSRWPRAASPRCASKRLGSTAQVHKQAPRQHRPGVRGCPWAAGVLWRLWSSQDLARPKDAFHHSNSLTIFFRHAWPACTTQGL